MISSSIGPCDQLLDLLSYQSFDLSVGYRQIKSVPTMFVMLSYSWLIPRAYTITSFGMTNTITVFTWWWKSSDMEIPMSCCWAHQRHFVSSMICVEHPTSIGKLYKHYLHVPFMKHMLGWKKWLSPSSRALGVSCRHEFETACFTSFGIIPSQSCTCEVLCGLIGWSPPLHMCS